MVFGMINSRIRSLVLLLGSAAALAAAEAPTPNVRPEAREWDATGTVKELRTNDSTMVIAHEAIADYMPAMTMPFNVKDKSELSRVSPGDRIGFKLHVTENESWIDHVTKTGTSSPESISAAASAPPQKGTRKRHPLLDYKFTNELNQAVSLSDFHGQALAITFFFTRCPIPEYCPRLSKNFQEASRKLSALPNAPTNWHFLSVTFDPENDTPAVLKGYAGTYHYDPSHWSFLTGPTNEISELARLSDIKFQRDGAFFNHDFRTQVVDANGRLQMVFPIGGDLSDALVREILKAASPTNPPASSGSAASN